MQQQQQHQMQQREASPALSGNDGDGDDNEVASRPAAPGKANAANGRGGVSTAVDARPLSQAAAAVLSAAVVGESGDSPDVVE